MKPQRVEDVLKTHQNFSQNMQQQMQQFSRRTSADVATPEDKRRQLQQYEQQLQAANEAKAAAIRRYDSDIQRYQAAITRLKAEISAPTGKSSQDFVQGED